MSREVLLHAKKEGQGLGWLQSFPPNQSVLPGSIIMIVLLPLDTSIIIIGKKTNCTVRCRGDQQLLISNNKCDRSFISLECESNKTLLDA